MVDFKLRLLFRMVLLLSMFLVSQKAQAICQNCLQDHKTWNQNKYYAFAYDFHVKRIPRFKRPIHPQYLHYFKQYYVVYSNYDLVMYYDVYENKRLFSRSFIHDNYVKYERFNANGKVILYQKLYYNVQGRLIREETYKMNRMFTYYKYTYNSQGKIGKVRIYNYHGDHIATLYYNYNNRNQLTSVTRLSERVRHQPKKSTIKRMDELFILSNVRSIKEKVYGLFKVMGELKSSSNNNLEGVYISVDLYDKKGIIVDTLITKVGDKGIVLAANGSIKFQTNETRKKFVRMRLYIHYKLKADSGYQIKGPFYFSRHQP